MGRAAGNQARKPRGNGADGLVPTVREFLPWHVVEKKMKARESGKQLRDEDEIEEVPDSGVYSSGEHHAANETDAPSLEGDLSFKVYTLAELEARGIASDLSVNATRMSLALMAQKPTPWEDVGRAALHVVRIAKTWLLAPSPRPSLKDVMTAPFVALGIELRAALRTVDWKKVGVYAGISLGTFLVLLFAVVTAADMTDDLKPSRAMTTQSGDSYTNAIVAARHAPPPAPAPVVTAAPAPAAQPGDGLEFSSEPASPAPVAPAPRARAGKGKKKAPVEVFIP